MRISDRLNREDKGFTLIELMVVVLIIAILIAIAIPTFLGARKRAQDRAAQANLRQTVTAGKVIFTDNESYCDAVSTSANPTAPAPCGTVPTSKLTDGEPAITFLGSGASSTGPPNVSVDSVDKDHFYAAAFSKANRCWFVRDVTTTSTPADAGTQWNKADPS